MVSHGSSDEQLIHVANKEAELGCLMEKVGCRGVLESACSKSVAGVNWVTNYVKHLPRNIANSLEMASSGRVFHFGGGGKRKSLCCLKLPTLIGKKVIYIYIYP